MYLNVKWEKSALNGYCKCSIKLLFDDDDGGDDGGDAHGGNDDGDDDNDGRR